jgi:hypothetical protein
MCAHVCAACTCWNAIVHYMCELLAKTAVELSDQSRHRAVFKARYFNVLAQLRQR